MSQKHSSIALLLFNKKGEIYAIEELIDKPELGKEKGHLSFPWETLEKDESLEAALKRLIVEEVDCSEGFSLAEVAYMGKIETSWATIEVYTARYDSLDDPWFFGSHAGIEYLPKGFIPKKMLLEKGRKGVEEVIGTWRILQSADMV